MSIFDHLIAHLNEDGDLPGSTCRQGLQIVANAWGIRILLTSGKNDVVYA